MLMNQPRDGPGKSAEIPSAPLIPNTVGDFVKLSQGRFSHFGVDPVEIHDHLERLVLDPDNPAVDASVIARADNVIGADFPGEALETNRLARSRMEMFLDQGVCLAGQSDAIRPLAASCSRAALFTSLPMIVYWMRSLLPKFPTWQ